MIEARFLLGSRIPYKSKKYGLRFHRPGIEIARKYLTLCKKQRLDYKAKVYGRMLLVTTEYDRAAWAGKG